MKQKLSTLHLSTLDLWPMGKNKGRVSIYLPLENFVKHGHDAIYLTNQKTQNTGYVKGIYVKQIWSPIRPLKIKNLQTITSLLILPFVTFNFFLAGLLVALKKKPDVIYAHTKETALPAYLLSRLFSSKYILRLYGINAHKGKSSIYKLLRIDLLLAIKLKADLYILTNDGTEADEYALKHGVSKERIHFLKNGIDKSWAKRKVDYSFGKHLANNGEKILLTVSRLAGWKQVDLIIKAMPGVLKLCSNIKLIIVGDGFSSNELKELTKILDIEKNVYFAGSQEQSKIFDFMTAADAFISMNALSSMTNPVFEAMICGKPVIALNKGNTEQVIIDNVTGILVQPDQIGELHNIIIELFRDSQKMIRIGKNAQNFILNEWPTWDERINYEVDLIEKLCTKQ